METCEDLLKNLFEESGYHFLGGRTTPHYGPYIWKKQWEEEYDIEVPLGVEKIKVTFLDDFIIKSWLDFATFSTISTSGWAEPDALFCIWDKYKDNLNQPNFQISFLRHEAQHVNDYKLFPNLTGSELEYRAKLVELIYYPDKSKFYQFIDASSESLVPHVKAANMIVNEMNLHFFPNKQTIEIKEWENIENSAIQDYANKLFTDNTNKLLAK